MNHALLLKEGKVGRCSNEEQRPGLTIEYPLCRDIQTINSQWGDSTVRIRIKVVSKPQVGRLARRTAIHGQTVDKMVDVTANRVDRDALHRRPRGTILRGTQHDITVSAAGFKATV